MRMVGGGSDSGGGIMEIEQWACEQPEGDTGGRQGIRKWEKMEVFIVIAMDMFLDPHFFNEWLKGEIS